MGKYGRCCVEGNKYEVHYESRTIALFDGDLDVVAIRTKYGWVRMSYDDLRNINKQVCQCRFSVLNRKRSAKNG